MKGDLKRRVKFSSQLHRLLRGGGERGGGESPRALGRGSRDLRRRRGGLDPEERGGVTGVGGARGAEGCGAL